MRNLIGFVLLVLFAACSAQEPILPTPASATQGAVSATEIPVVAATTVPPQSATPVPTLAPRSTSVPPPSVLPPITIVPAATRGPNARAPGPGPVCNRAADVPTVAAGELGSPDNPIVIGLVTYGDAETTAEAGAELADCLGKITGLTFAVVTGASARETVEHLASGQAQLGFLDVLAIMYGQEKYGFETGLVILRTEDDGLQPYARRDFFANKAAGIETMADVAGKTFCFGEPDHLLNTTLPRILMAAHGVDPDTGLAARVQQRFADSIAMAVYRGECDAGSGYREILTFPGEALQTYPDLGDKVETFYVSDPIPNDGVQFARGVNEPIKAATTAALLKMAADNPGKHRPLVTLYKIEGFERVGNEFYAEFGELVKRAGVDLATLVR